jgi:hypothetical protein
LILLEKIRIKLLQAALKGSKMKIVNFLDRFLKAKGRHKKTACWQADGLFCFSLIPIREKQKSMN